MADSFPAMRVTPDPTDRRRVLLLRQIPILANLRPLHLRPHPVDHRPRHLVAGEVVLEGPDAPPDIQRPLRVRLQRTVRWRPECSPPGRRLKRWRRAP